MKKTKPSASNNTKNLVSQEPLYFIIALVTITSLISMHMSIAKNRHIDTLNCKDRVLVLFLQAIQIVTAASDKVTIPSSTVFVYALAF